MSPFERLRGAHLTAHPVLEDLVFTALSLLVLTVAVAAIAATPQPMVAVAAAPVAPAAPNEIVIYGTLVDQAGDPLPWALITVRNPAGQIVALAFTDADGNWDVSIIGPAANYTVRVTTISGGQLVQGQTHVSASPGMVWGVQMVFSQPSSWVFVPLPGY